MGKVPLYTVLPWKTTPVFRGEGQYNCYSTPEPLQTMTVVKSLQSLYLSTRKSCCQKFNCAKILHTSMCACDGDNCSASLQNAKTQTEVTEDVN